jgi:GxxExxY protein
LQINDITGSIISAAMKVHSGMGPGLLESTYEACLAHELRKRGFNVQQQVPLPVVYDGVRLDVGYRIDRRTGRRLCDSGVESMRRNCTYS